MASPVIVVDTMPAPLAGVRDCIIRLSDVQFRAWESTARYLDAEGAIRSGKSWMGATKLATLCATHPGIHCLAARWSETDLDAQLKPLWRDIAASYGLTVRWNATEQYDEVVGTGARVYLRGLKAGETTSRYAKFRGLTLSHIWVDQAEEIPHDVYQELKGRLSQPGYPHQLMLTPNPPNEGHWISTEFPERDDTPDHAYLRFTLRDNAHHLDASTVDAIEAAYPEGTAQRRRLIDGRRGLSAHGDPVYTGYFRRGLHVQPVTMDSQVPLLESWDFGHAFPCVVWAQVLPWGEFRVLGGLMGRNQFLPDFARLALQQRQTWFPSPLDVHVTCDPAGEQSSNQGAPQRAVDMLRDVGVFARAIAGANHPERRNYAIQRLSDHMRRRTALGGEAFTINPRFLVWLADGPAQAEVLVDALEAGYVWDDRLITTTTSPNTRRPKKDGYYDHSMNCVEYLMLAFGDARASETDTARLQARVMRTQQLDTDEYDRRVGRRRPTRGGY